MTSFFSNVHAPVVIVSMSTGRHVCGDDVAYLADAPWPCIRIVSGNASMLSVAHSVRALIKQDSGFKLLTLGVGSRKRDDSHCE